MDMLINRLGYRISKWMQDLQMDMYKNHRLCIYMMLGEIVVSPCVTHHWDTAENRIGISENNDGTLVNPLWMSIFDSYVKLPEGIHASFSYWVLLYGHVWVPPANFWVVKSSFELVRNQLCFADESLCSMKTMIYQCFPTNHLWCYPIFKICPQYSHINSNSLPKFTRFHWSKTSNHQNPWKSMSVGTHR